MILSKCTQRPFELKIIFYHALWSRWIIESNEKGAQRHAHAAFRFLQPKWCQIMTHTSHTCHKCSIRHPLISNYPWSKYAPHPHTTCRAHKAHTGDVAITELRSSWHTSGVLTSANILHCSWVRERARGNSRLGALLPVEHCTWRPHCLPALAARDLRQGAPDIRIPKRQSRSKCGQEGVRT